MSDFELSDTENDMEESKPTFTILNGGAKSNKNTFNEDNVGDDDVEQNLDNEDEEIEDVAAADDDDVDDDAEVVDDDDDDDDDDEIVEDDEDEEYDDEFDPDGKPVLPKVKAKSSKNKNVKNISELPTTTINIPVEYEKNDSDYDSDEDDVDEDDYLQKFDNEMRKDYLLNQHPESIYNNYDEIYNLAKVHRNKENIIDDNLHKTIPILTKYEKTRILGIRAKQINNGAKPLCKVQPNMIDGYLIALKELEQKLIPVIIRRPLPNGTSEYWHLKDLEILH